MTVVELRVDSYKRMRAAHVVPSATGLVLVRGKNAAGKSTLIESMLDALGAEKADLPITEGEHAAEVVVNLGELVVTKKWTRDSAGKAKAVLTVEAADGVPKKGPAGVLKELRSVFADPVAFLELTAAEQVKKVLEVLGMDVDLAKMEAFETHYYDLRRLVGRDVDRLGKAVAEIASEVEGLPAPPAESSIEALTAELQAAKDHNALSARYRQAMGAAESRGKEAAARLERLELEVVKLEAEVVEQRQAWQQAAEGAKGHEPVDVSLIVEALTAHEDAAKHAGRRELLESTRSQHEEARAKHEHADAGLEQARRNIAELLGGADFPVDGMAYDHEAKTLTIGGIPFGQASQAERLKAAASIAMAGSPAIKVMFAREGSLLDAESRQQLAYLAEAAGFQLWLEVVDSPLDECAFEGCGNPAELHGARGMMDHEFEKPAFDGEGIWIEDGEAFQ